MNVRDSDFAREGLAFIDEHQAGHLDGVAVAAEDVLLNITGASVARVCRPPADVLPARVNQHVAIIRPTSAFDPRFLEKCLLFPTMKRQLLKIAAAGATRQAITKAEIESLLIVCPPRNLQDRFADVVKASEAIRRSYLVSGDRMDALFASLQQRAFRGEL
jgi:restriction endonuclease S subunit